MALWLLVVPLLVQKQTAGVERFSLAVRNMSRVRRPRLRRLYAASEDTLMLTRLALAALLVPLPTIVFAQSSPVCDGSEVRRAEHKRVAGTALMFGAAAADLASLLTIPRTPDGAKVASKHFAVVAATSPLLITGFYISRRASPGESFWERVLSRMKVGETRAADVQLCLHRPDISSRSTKEERWTYVTARPFTTSGTFSALRLTFRDSVLADVEQTEVNHVADAVVHDDGPLGVFPPRHGFCSPPIPVIADPFPTPTDTTAAAAAMARAQADADAASKNAQNQAAYATCMASDTAQ